MTAEERAQIQQAARRYVREVAPIPPTAILEQVARIVMEAKATRLALQSQGVASRRSPYLRDRQTERLSSEKPMMSTVTTKSNTGTAEGG